MKVFWGRCYGYLDSPPSYQSVRSSKKPVRSRSKIQNLLKMMPLINKPNYKSWRFILPIVRIIENVIPGKSPQQGKLLQTLVEFNFFHADFFTNIEFIITIIRLCFFCFHLLYPWQPYYARITFLCVAIKYALLWRHNRSSCRQ